MWLIYAHGLFIVLILIGPSGLLNPTSLILILRVLIVFVGNYMNDFFFLKITKMKRERQSYPIKYNIFSAQIYFSKFKSTVIN